MAKSVGVMLSVSEVPRLVARREKTANGDRKISLQLWRLMIALKSYAD